MDAISLSDNESFKRYQLRRGGVVALGSKLAKFALDDIRQRGLKVVPRCEFMATWIERHPDYADLLAS